MYYGKQKKSSLKLETILKILHSANFNKIESNEFVLQPLLL